MALFFLVLISQGAIAEQPQWINNSVKLIEGGVELACVGNGPDLSTARKIALNDCRMEATEYLSKNFVANSLIIESMQSASYHSAISSSASYKNMHCNPKGEYFTESDNSTKVYILCQFNLSKVEVKESPIPKIVELDTVEDRGIASTKPNITSDFAKSISIATIPSCNDILVTGSVPRKIDCSQNPTVFVVKKSDNELLVRRDGYKPKKVLVSDIIQSKEEVYDVHLDK